MTNFLNAQSMQIPIIPAPQIIKSLEGRFILRDNISITTPDKNEEIIFIVSLIQQTLKEYHNINSSTSNRGDIKFNYIKTNEQNEVIKNLNEEGYVIRIHAEKILIEAKTSKGFYYAAMSLIQMLEKTDGSLPCVEIIDWPDMKIRGVSDDISRGQVSTVDNFKKIISHIARYKMNTYMPYIEDMLEFDKYPTIGKGRGALTKAEVREILAFAKQNFVEVIPIFQTLGHYENILSQEEFLKYAEFPGAASLNVSSEETYKFLEDLLKELFELFPSKYFHMGADESWDVGLGKSKKLVEQTNIAVVHANHYKKVYDICKKYNKKVMMYGDILLDHPEILSLIPKDIIIVDWQYRADENYPSTKVIRDAGFEYIVSPSAWNFVSTFPANVNSLPNIKYIIKSGIENESLGMINSNWGDYGAETFKEFVLYNYAWSAQCSWNYSQSNLSEFTEIYFYDYFGINDSRLTAIYETLSNPLNQILWNELWRHPLLKFKEPAWWESKTSKAVKLAWNELTLPRLKHDLKDLKLKVRKNKDHLDLVEFLLNLNDWYKIKVETQFDLQKILKPNSNYSSKNLLIKIDENITQLNSLKEEYRRLWLRYYKQDNLNMIEDKFTRLISYFGEIKEQLLNNSIQEFNHLLSSKWLYLKSSDTTFARKAEFITSFDLSAKPLSAYLQIMGDTYVQLYINDKFVDKVYARRSLSLLVEYKRIKFVDIKPFLTLGKNTITVTAESFHPKNGAGFNLIANIETQDSTILIKSDDSPASAISWRGREDSMSEWQKPVSKQYPFEIISPNFKTKRTSWIER